MKSTTRHWGVTPSDGCLRGVDVRCATAGVAVTLIDFTLSRLDTDVGGGHEGGAPGASQTAFFDLESDPELFQGPKGDCQVPLCFLPSVFLGFSRVTVRGLFNRLIQGASGFGGGGAAERSTRTQTMEGSELLFEHEPWRLLVKPSQLSIGAAQSEK